MKAPDRFANSDVLTGEHSGSWIELGPTRVLMTNMIRCRFRLEPPCNAVNSQKVLSGVAKGIVFWGSATFVNSRTFLFRLAEGHEVRVSISEPMCHGILAGLVSRTDDWNADCLELLRWGMTALFCSRTSPMNAVASKMSCGGKGSRLRRQLVWR